MARMWCEFELAPNSPKHGFDLILLMWCEFELAPKLDASVLC